MSRKRTAFCKACGWPLLHQQGWILPEEDYKGDTREPRPRRHSPAGYCNQCEKPAKPQTEKATYIRPPSPCPCGSVATCTLDCPNDEFFVYCPACGQQGPRCETEPEAKCKWTKGERDEGCI